MLKRSERRTKPYKILPRDGKGAKAWSKKKRKAMSPVSQKERRKRTDRAELLDQYFEKFGWAAADGTRRAACQVCGHPMERAGANYHHKLLKSQGGKDTACNALACHATCHLFFLHDGLMGMPVTEDGKARIHTALDSGVCLLTNLTVKWSAQQTFDINKMISRWGI